jgi:hypothetical protein
MAEQIQCVSIQIAAGGDLVLPKLASIGKFKGGQRTGQAHQLIQVSHFEDAP